MPYRFHPLVASSLAALAIVSVQATRVLSAYAAEPLSPEAIAQRQSTIPDWTVEGQVLRCTYEVANFVEAVDFVNQIVEPAESMGHHPDLTIRYNQVDISLTTHDAGGLTALDFELAEAISAMSDRTCQS